MNEFLSKMKEFKSEIILFLSFWLFYSLTITQNYSLSHDSTYYLNNIEFEGWTFHPHHLIFHVIAKLWYNFTNIIPLINKLDISYKVGIFNSLFAALSLSYLLRFFSNKLNFSRFNSYGLVFLVGFSWGFWYYSGCFEVYIIPLYFIMLAAANLMEFMNGSQNLNRAIVYISVATLYHQSNILLFAALFLLLIFFKREKILNNFTKIILISFVIIGIPYLFAGIIFNANYSFAEFWSWLTLYGHGVPEHWSKFGLGMLKNDAAGFLRTFYSSYFIYSIESISQFMVNAFKDKWLGEEIFLVRNMSSTTGYILLSSVILSLLGYLVLIINNFKNVKENFQKNKNFLVIIIFFSGILSVFFTFWSSSNLEFWIPQNLFILILIVSLFAQNKKILNKIIILSIIIISFSVNFFGGIYYSVDKHNDLYYSQISGIIKSNLDNTLVITPNRLVLTDYLIRYKVKNFISIDDFYISTKNRDSLIIKLDEKINQSTSEYIYATYDLKKLDSTKYDHEFVNFVNDYFNDTRFDIVPINKNQISEYYLIKKKILNK
jgi:hypothetical protein